MFHWTYDDIHVAEMGQRMLGDVIDWLGEACSSLNKRAEPTFSAPRAGL